MAQGRSQPRGQEGLLIELRTNTGRAGEVRVAGRQEEAALRTYGRGANGNAEGASGWVPVRESGLPSIGSEEMLEGFQLGCQGPPVFRKVPSGCWW